MEISVEQILVFMYVLTHLLPLSAATNLCQQVVFLHNTQNGLWVVAKSLCCLSATATSVGIRRYESILPAAAGWFQQGQHLFRVASSALQSCNSRFWTLQRIGTLPVQDTVSGDGRLLHTLPLLSLPSCGSQKIPQQLILHSQSLDLVCLLRDNISGRRIFRGRPFGRGVIPASIFACLWLYRLIQFLTCDLLNPNRSAISCRVAPPCRILRISCSNACICVYFLRDIRTPPV